MTALSTFNPTKPPIPVRSITWKFLIFLAACFALGIIQLQAQEEQSQAQEEQSQAKEVPNCYVTVSVKDDEKQPRNLLKKYLLRS